MNILNNNSDKNNKNLYLINNYIKNFENLNNFNSNLLSKYNITKEYNDKINKKIKNIRFNGYSVFYFIDKIEDIEKEANKIWDNFYKEADKRYMLEYNCFKAYEDLNNSNILSMLDNCYNYYSIWKKNTKKGEITEKDCLYDFILNN